MKHKYEITVVVSSDEKFTKARVKQLVKRLIDCGMEDASNTPGEWQDPDALDAVELDIAVK